MDPNELRQELAKLRTDLATADRVDPESRELLGQIMRDITRLTESPSPARVPAGRSADRLTDKLELAAVRFEADHPSVAATARRLIDLLGKAGL
jgi:hypothetical protein